MNFSSYLLIIGFMSLAFWGFQDYANINKFDTLKNTYTQEVSQNKPVILYFYTETCHYCVEFSPIIKEISQEYKDKYTFIPANAEEQENYSIYESFQAQGVPSLYLLKPAEKKCKQIYTRDKTELQNELNNFLN